MNDEYLNKLKEIRQKYGCSYENISRQTSQFIQYKNQAQEREILGQRLVSSSCNKMKRSTNHMPVEIDYNKYTDSIKQNTMKRSYSMKKSFNQEIGNNSKLIDFSKIYDNSNWQQDLYPATSALKIRNQNLTLDHNSSYLKEVKSSYNHPSISVANNQQNYYNFADTDKFYYPTKPVAIKQQSPYDLLKSQIANSTTKANHIPLLDKTINVKKSLHYQKPFSYKGTCFQNNGNWGIQNLSRVQDKIQAYLRK